MDSILSDHHELCQVDRIDSFAQDCSLASPLSDRMFVIASTCEEFCRVLIIVTRYDATQCLLGPQWLAIAGEDVTNLSLRNHRERGLDDAVLPRPKKTMQTT